MQYWNSYSQQIYKQCLLRIKDVDLVNDAMQDIYLKLHNHVKSLENHENPRAWLFLVTKNHCYDCIRKRHRRGEMLFRDLSENYVTDIRKIHSTEKDPELSFALKKIMNGLPSMDELLIYLHHVEGYTLNELAAMFDISRTVIAKNVTQSMRFLRNSVA